VRPTGIVRGRVTDDRGQPVPFANVVVVGARRGAMTDENGIYRISNLEPSTYSIQVQGIGMEKKIREGIRVENDQVAMADVQVHQQRVQQIEEISVGSQQIVVARGAATRLSGPPFIPTTGGTALPNDERFDSMFFKNYGVNPFVAANEDPLSTF